MSPQAAERHRPRVLVLAPTGRDAAASAELLARADLSAQICANLDALVAGLAAEADAVFVAEEALLGRPIDRLCAWVEAQPPWSDMPFVMLTSHREQPVVVAGRSRLVAALRNVSLLERPVQAITLTSTIQAAVRARRRQYEVRRYLAEQERAARELEDLVAARTRELEAANQELRAQIAERERMEVTLRHAQKIEAMGQLTGGVAHDFNNLLMVISGGLDMIDRQDDPGRRKRLMDGMRQAAGRGAALTRQLLAFSRRQALRSEPVDLGRQIGGMRELLDRSLSGDVHVTLDFAATLWPVEVDPGELELVVLNLAVNARDAMPEGGTITIRAENLAGLAERELCGDFVRLSIIDTGIGMPPEVVSRAFEPFFTTKDIGKGSGLGLAQVYGFAKQSGGTVRIETAVGRGTTIALFLPRSHKAPAVEEHHLIDLHAGRPAAGVAGHVLLVEDDDEVAALVSEMLSQLGFEATRASSGAAALGALTNGRAFDLVFSDIMMPGGMNGVDLAREVRRRRPGLPVLLTTAYAAAAKRDAEAEGVAVLPKPYRLEELAAATRNVLGR
ncbi:hybrid sensor histidine kinase/response regulator [Siccirubricoccus deserti]|uniref:histidine kinase n=1 Tax=Siccirubricoccus deserti TaxID=2013562 RepID=A0A9X0R1W4_9PROT|nr:ATP-binding protein [Siccirubricoccus deserti]MBC4017303.1 response regulator [Siccirubricoccus deserti]GGC58035.1 hybrid sensor histidine kinase/response regulator [Siccirubricoccus deserti]